MAHLDLSAPQYGLPVRNILEYLCAKVPILFFVFKAFDWVTSIEVAEHIPKYGNYSLNCTDLPNSWLGKTGSLRRSTLTTWSATPSWG